MNDLRLSPDNCLVHGLARHGLVRDSGQGSLAQGLSLSIERARHQGPRGSARSAQPDSDGHRLLLHAPICAAPAEHSAIARGLTVTATPGRSCDEAPSSLMVETLQNAAATPRFSFAGMLKRVRIEPFGRDFTKTITFLVLHLLVGFTVAYLFTGSLALASGIALVEPLVNAVVFFFHERAWRRTDVPLLDVLLHRHNHEIA